MSIVRNVVLALLGCGALVVSYWLLVYENSPILSSLALMGATAFLTATVWLTIWPAER